MSSRRVGPIDIPKWGGDSRHAPQSITAGHVAAPDFKHPSGVQVAKLVRQKPYRIILHSDDRENPNSTSPANATFLLGDLQGLWGLRHENIDAGELHWNLLVSAFTMSTILQPKTVEIYGYGLPIGSDTFDTSTGGLSTLLAIVPAEGADELNNDLSAFVDDPNSTLDAPKYVHATKAHLASDAPMSLTQIPGGKITIQLKDHHGTHWDSDTLLKWSMILTLNPVEVQVGN